MKLRKTIAFLIALSMLVGLVFTAPVSALTPVEGYVETVVVDEAFNKTVGSKLTVFNGSVEDGVLNFELSAESFMAMNEGFDTKNNKQYIVEFEMTTEQEYVNPFTGSFIGLRVNKAQAKPSGSEEGAWVGITTDKVIFWFSHEYTDWARTKEVEGEDGEVTEEFISTEGVDYLVIDAPFDLSSASYKLIYEGDVIELYVDEVLLATFSLSDGYAVLKSGDDSLTSTVKLNRVQNYRYFTLYNGVTGVVEDDPLESRPSEDFDKDEPVEDPEEPGVDPEEPGVDPEEPGVDPDEPGVDPDEPGVDPDEPGVDPDEPGVDPDEPEEEPEEPEEGGIPEDTEMQFEGEIELYAKKALVTVDNFVVRLYKDQLATDATIAELEAKRDEIQEVIDAYYSEDTEDDKYLAGSLDIEKLEDAVASIDELLATENLLEATVKEKITSLSGIYGKAISYDVAMQYPSKFAGFEAVIEELLADEESGYSEEQLTSILEMIEEAKALLEEDGVTTTDLDRGYEKVLKAVSDLNVYTENGIPTYEQSFTGGLSLSQFEKDWYHTGASHQSVYLNTANGIPINLWGAYSDQAGCFRYQMHFNKSYPVYSVQATLTREAAGKMMFGIRQTLRSDNYEQDYISGTTMIGFQGVSIQEAGAANNLENIYIVIKDGTYKATDSASRVATKINLSSVPGVLSSDKKSFTPLIKDFGEIIEIYAVNADGENVPLAKIVFDALVTKVVGNGTTYDGYSSGTLYNLVTDEVIPFNGMCVRLAKDSVISFSSRSGRYCVKDFKINTNILPSEEVLVFDGSTDPESISIDVEKDTIAVDEAVGFSVNAAFEKLKVAGKDEYKAGSIDVKAAPAVEISTVLGDSVVTVDTIDGTITGVCRGTEIITVSYTAASGEVLTEKILVTVNDETYTAPTEDDAFEERIVAARFANTNVFKSVEVGTELVPVIEYEYPNGDTGILPADCYVKYFSENEDIVAYDETKGAYVAVAEGYAKLYAEVYITKSTEPILTAKVNVEVAAEGKATLGASTTIAIQDLIDATDDETLTTEEKIAALDAAIAAEVAIAYNDELDAELLFAAIAYVKEDESLSNEDILKTAMKNAKAVRKVYEVVNNPDSTADDLAFLLFGEDGIYRELDINKRDYADYEDLTKTKAARVNSRLFTQIERAGTDLTAAYIAESFATIVDTVSAGSGSGKGGTTITTGKNNGSVTFPAATNPVKPAEPVKEVITEEQINAAAAKFADADEAAWAKPAIGTLVHKGIISGYEDGTMRPNGVITRDEFVKLLVVAFDLEIKTNAYNYFWEDVPADGWQVPYIAAAHEANILSGTNGGAFGSNVRITREDMASMIYKAVLMKQATLPSDKMVAFTDAENITGYALEAVNKLAAAGVISGMGDGTFAPKAGATRAQAFQMIYLILEVM